jgi:DNA polymerase-3 subunit alpha
VNGDGQKFVHLHLHSEYSLVDGVVRIKPLVKQAAELQMAAVAITDLSNLFALVKFYRAALSAGIKPIFGSDLLLFNEEDPVAPFKLAFLIQNAEGYRNLTELVSLGYTDGQHQGIPIIQREWIEARHEGLIVLSGGLEGDVGRALSAEKPQLARELAASWAALFGDRYYMELQRTSRKGEADYLLAAVDLAAELSIAVVATNDVHFLNQDEFDAHEARVCIHDGRALDDPRRPKKYSQEQYLKSPEEMQLLFSDIPEALENSVEIAKRCNLKLKLGDNYLPNFPTPKGMGIDEFFRLESEKGLEERLQKRAATGTGSDEENRKIYDDRLKRELDVILQMGFPGYFLIVADFIQWAKNNQIPVGPGRGSGAGSLVAYALKITDLDPIEFDLLFERFLNPERVSMPDFDIDFCMEGRDRVIEYVAQTYGKKSVSQIITYGTMAAKAVIRDVGRVLGHGYGFVDRLAKLIPFEIGITLQRALDENIEFKELYESDDEVKTLIDLAKKLEGITRNAGKHAGGVVIAPSNLTDFSPLYCEQGGGNLVTQFDKDDVEAVGLVKFDFLGLRTLTIIDWAVLAINRRAKLEGFDPVDIEQIPRDDPKAYELLKKGETTAVFQLESRGMKELIKKLMPDCFDDIIALVALYRPGPLEAGMVDDYIKVKHGAKAEYAHPMLESILEPTNGVILYQEQVMQIAQELAGYTLGGADLLRRAMGKKKPEEMAKQRTIFTEGAVSQGIDEKIATYIFDLMEKFAGYGFNKSHSAAYALVAYQTAWLKAHFPAEFMAAVLSADMDNTDKVVILIDECRELSLKILPPCINRSSYHFNASADGEIVYGLGALKGVGESAIEEIIENRSSDNPYKGLTDLCKRIDLRKVNRRVLDGVIKAGALDQFSKNRAQLLSDLPSSLKIADQYGRMNLAGQNDLFGLGDEEVEEDASFIAQEIVPEWSEEQRLAEEKLILGLYLTGHPIEQYLEELSHYTGGRLAAQMAACQPQPVGKNGRAYGGGVKAIVAGLVIELRGRQTKQGKQMMFATLDDRSARLEVAIYTEACEQYGQLVSRDTLLVAEGKLSMDDFSGLPRLIVEKLMTIEEARAYYAKQLSIEWPEEVKAEDRVATRQFIEGLSEAITPFKGGVCPIQLLNYKGLSATASFQFGESWKVHPTNELLSRLKKHVGGKYVKIRYRY